MHPPGRVALRHFLMNDPASRRHPLHITAGNSTAISHAIAVLHGSREDVRNGLDPAVRMPRKTRQILLRNVVAKVVQEEKRVEIRSVAETERTPQVHSRPLE